MWPVAGNSSIALHLFVSSLLFPTNPRPYHWCPHPRLVAAQYYLTRPRLALVSFCFTSFPSPRYLWLLIFVNNFSLDSPSEFGKRLWTTLTTSTVTPCCASSNMFQLALVGMIEVDQLSKAWWNNQAVSQSEISIRNLSTNERPPILVTEWVTDWVSDWQGEN